MLNQCTGIVCGTDRESRRTRRQQAMNLLAFLIGAAVSYGVDIGFAYLDVSTDGISHEDWQRSNALWHAPALFTVGYLAFWGSKKAIQRFQDTETENLLEDIAPEEDATGRLNTLPDIEAGDIQSTNEVRSTTNNYGSILQIN